MKITVRQLKTLIREAAAEAMDEMKTDEGHAKDDDDKMGGNLQMLSGYRPARY